MTSGNYYVEIFAHPTEPNTVISMDVFNQITRDGGKSWSRLGEEYKHVDNHVIWIDPTDPNYMLSSYRGSDDPAEGLYGGLGIGFRVATVPEPSTAVLVIFAVGTMWVLRKRPK